MAWSASSSKSTRCGQGCWPGRLRDLLPDGASVPCPWQLPVLSSIALVYVAAWLSLPYLGVVELPSEGMQSRVTKLGLQVILLVFLVANGCVAWPGANVMQGDKVLMRP
jgi:hypothetical protein